MPDVEADEVEAVIKRIQLFDPVGVGARSYSGMFIGTTAPV